MNKCPHAKQNPNKPCRHKNCEWWIKHKEYFNCFEVYKYFMCKNHTLQEIARLLEISHTTVKQIETIALNKLKQLTEDGKLNLKELKKIMKSKP
jgi:hypothetical protein